MDAKEIKSSLKEARENIKNKDFKNALKVCKNVLKADRSNYVGLVLFGVALQETDQKDQAPNAFKKAIDVSPKQILAWQGLASFFEKEKTISNQKELINVYLQLLSLETDINKFSDISSKLMAVCTDLKEYDVCISTLEQQEASFNEENKRIIWKIVVSHLGQIKELSPKLSESLETVLGKIVDDGSFEDTEEYFKKFLKLLYKHKKLLILIEKAQVMHNQFPKSEYPLEWICRAYSELVTLNNIDSNLKINIEEYYNKLSEINPKSSMVILAQGAKLYQDGLYSEAIDPLKQVLSVMPTSYYIWALLCQCYLRVYCYEDSELCATEALRIMKNQNSSNYNLQRKLNVLLIKSLSYQTDSNKAMEAIEKCKELLLVEHGNLEVLSYLTRAYISADDLESAQKCNLVLKEQENYKVSSALLDALVLKKDGMSYRAMEILKNAVSEFPNEAELWLELGKLQWKEEKHDVALVSFLKAAKLDPNNYENFVYLGKFYNHSNRDIDKARRCFQKAFQLNQRSEEAGAGLSDIYRQQKNVELNIQLLTYVTQQAGPGGAKWAWLRLGLYHQDKGKYSEAVDSLRSAVRCDPTDSHCWESLADAYFAKGSYTCALRSYEKVVELNPEALYPAFQVASIKQLVGMFEESVDEYKKVVAANPKYVPALKGLGETCLLVAKSYLSRQMRGLCRDMCQEAVEALTLAAQEHRNLSCLWKLLGDACTILTDLHESEVFLKVQKWLTVSSHKIEIEDHDTEILQKEQVLQLGARCYCRSLSIANNSSLLWQDLAVNYNCQANYASSFSKKKQLREWALMAAKQSVMSNCKSYLHWNMLGVIAVSPEIKNFKLAQHAFIKSLHLEKSNAVAWTNLGTIYFKLKEIKLANEAYREAQRTEPTYAQCWIGQAMLAESFNHEDTMDLFRHTTSLSVHPESCLGYAQWVCSTLLYSTNKTDPLYIYSIEAMHAVPTAGDCMTWYTGSIPTDACAFNMLGLLMERQKLYNTAGQAFARALQVLETDKGNKIQELQDKVHCNYGRVLVQLQRYDEAIKQYLEIKEASLVSQCGLAVAYYKAEKYEDSYTAYETILHWLAPDDGLKSHVLVAMAAMAYKFQGVEHSKTLLFKCVQLKPPSVQGLFAFCSLGIIHEDLHLSEMVLKELIPHQKDPQYVTHIAVFKAYVHYLKNRKEGGKEAVRYLSSPTHLYPGQASLWLALALLLLNMYPNCDPSSAAACAQIALYLGQNNMDVSKVMSLVSLGHLLSEKAIPSLRSSQKAVHMFPQIPENWVVLIASFMPWCIYYQKQSDAMWLKQLIGHVRRKMDATRQMGKWLSRYEHKVSQLADEFVK